MYFTWCNGKRKTEIYLKLIEKEISQGRQGIVLVPEISLTPQMIRRFLARFGDVVAVILVASPMAKNMTNGEE